MNRPVAAIILALAVIGAGASSAHAEELSLEDAFALALGSQPSLTSARLRIDGAMLDEEALRVAAHPTYGLSAGVSASAAEPTSLLQPGLRASVDLVGSWRLYDFGRRAADRAAARASSAAARVQLTASERSTLAAVEQAYAGVLGAMQRAEVAATTVASERRHLDEARRYVAAEARTAIEVAQAEARLASAEVSQVQADNAVAVARAALARAIGAPLPIDTTFARAWPGPLAGEDAALEVLLAEAERTDPALATLEAERTASAAARDAARLSQRPTLSASGGLGLGSSVTTDDAAWSASWNVGVNLSWQFGDGGSRALALRRAEVALRSVDAEAAARRVELRYQVSAARIALIGARAQGRAAAISQRAASEQLRLAEGRSAAGVGTPAELADAQDAVTTAGGAVADADYQLALARATLRHLLGRIAR
jgi:outer membrane protein